MAKRRKVLGVEALAVQNAVVGRPRRLGKNDERTQQIAVRLTDTMVDAIDAEIAHLGLPADLSVTRSDMVRSLINEAIGAREATRKARKK